MREPGGATRTTAPGGADWLTSRGGGDGLGSQRRRQGMPSPRRSWRPGGLRQIHTKGSQWRRAGGGDRGYPCQGGAGDQEIRGRSTLKGVSGGGAGGGDRGCPRQGGAGDQEIRGRSTLKGVSGGGAGGGDRGCPRQGRAGDQEVRGRSTGSQWRRAGGLNVFCRRGVALHPTGASGSRQWTGEPLAERGCERFQCPDRELMASDGQALSTVGGRYE
ncbi:unnamed protein product [Leuciscus chuanchicus]